MKKFSGIFKVLIYFHTIRFLKPSQIYWRIFYKIFFPRVRACPPCEVRPAKGEWVSPVRRRQSFDGAGNFNFLNENGRLSVIGWDGPQHEKLWRYNQHYFDDLNAEGSADRVELHRALIEDWIKFNRLGTGIGWDPYPTSLRIVNWTKWLFAGNSLDRPGLESLATQAQWLFQKIEWHILGNHLFANAKALIFAGIYFEGSEARGWLKCGLNIVSRELPEQVLDDGGNFERSPKYHAIFLEDLLDLINLAERYPDVIRSSLVSQWRSTAAKMINWLNVMCHPDGEIAFFNDAAIGIAPTPEEIFAYAHRLGLSADRLGQSDIGRSIIQLPDSGYLRLNSTKAVALLDVAPIGPDYLPGHAHADTLSFELSLFGTRVLVNGGTSQYGTGPTRLEERGTAAHNTVTIDGENSSEVWSGFRVARRAYPMNLEVKQDAEVISVTCSHDGYTRLPGKAVHTRSWVLQPGELVVNDRIAGEFGLAVARFHLHPDVQVARIDQFKYTLFLPNSQRTIDFIVRGGVSKIESSNFSPEFGIRLASQCISNEFRSGEDTSIKMIWTTDD